MGKCRENAAGYSRGEAEQAVGMLVYMYNNVDDQKEFWGEEGPQWHCRCEQLVGSRIQPSERRQVT